MSDSSPFNTRLELHASWGTASLLAQGQQPPLLRAQLLAPIHSSESSVGRFNTRRGAVELADRRWEGKLMSFVDSMGTSRFLKTIRGKHRQGVLVVKVFVKPDPSLSLKAMHRRLKCTIVSLGNREEAS